VVAVPPEAVVDGVAAVAAVLAPADLAEEEVHVGWVAEVPAQATNTP
jgi:hypothetical protein